MSARILIQINLIYSFIFLFILFNQYAINRIRFAILLMNQQYSCRSPSLFLQQLMLPAALAADVTLGSLAIHQLLNSSNLPRRGKLWGSLYRERLQNTRLFDIENPKHEMPETQHLYGNCS